MATTPLRKTRRQFKAILMNDDLIELEQSLMTEVYDKGGRRRWSHDDNGESDRVVLAELSVREAGALLRSLADALAFIAEEGIKRGNAAQAGQ